MAFMRPVRCTIAAAARLRKALLPAGVRRNLVNTLPEFDYLLLGGAVIDGTGAEAIRCDVGVRDDRIAAVGDLSGAAAGRRIDVTGMRVTPGFIDIHTHSDISVTYDPGQGSALAMGVTTQVVGNCGLAMGHTSPDAVFEFEKRWLAPHGATIRWNSFREFLQQVEEGGTATNIASLSAHGTLRKRVVGIEKRPVTGEELRAMKRELETALAAGCWGLSSGLEYPPSAYADEDELAELCSLMRGSGAIYATHLRNEGDTLVESVQEAINVAERAGVPLQLSHHKAEHRPNWGKVRTTLGMVEQARQRGLDVQLDQYPYTAFMTALTIQILPLWAQAGAVEETTALLRDPAHRARVAADMRANHPEWDGLSDAAPWANIFIGVCRGRPEVQGRSIAELASEARQNPIDYALDLLAATESYIAAVNFAIDEGDIAQILRCPWTSIGSDSVGTHPEGSGGVDKVHPRAYGTFPRVLGRYVREQGVLTEAEAIYRMTGLPAARMRMAERGRIAPGFVADITVYDPCRVADAATFADPHRYPVGIRAVFVNGRIALENERPNGTLAGRVLRPASK